MKGNSRGLDWQIHYSVTSKWVEIFGQTMCRCVWVQSLLQFSLQKALDLWKVLLLLTQRLQQDAHGWPLQSGPLDLVLQFIFHVAEAKRSVCTYHWKRQMGEWLLVFEMFGKNKPINFCSSHTIIASVCKNLRGFAPKHVSLIVSELCCLRLIATYFNCTDNFTLEGYLLLFNQLISLNKSFKLSSIILWNLQVRGKVIAVINTMTLPSKEINR